jgi:hypothetical protein
MFAWVVGVTLGDAGAPAPPEAGTATVGSTEPVAGVEFDPEDSLPQATAPTREQNHNNQGVRGRGFEGAISDLLRATVENGRLP